MVTPKRLLELDGLEPNNVGANARVWWPQAIAFTDSWAGFAVTDGFESATVFESILAGSS